MDVHGHKRDGKLSCLLMSGYLYLAVFLFSSVGFMTAIDGQGISGSYFVSPNGRDTWAGLLPEANSTLTDGPFASLERARDELRKIKEDQAGGSTKIGSYTVSIRGGRYYLPKTVLFDERDSNATYCAYKNEKPVFIGGKPLTKFTTYKGSILQADIATQGMRGATFRQFFFNGHRQIMARHPNFDKAKPYSEGWAYVDGDPIPISHDTPHTSRNSFRYKAGDIPEAFDISGAQIFIFPRFDWWNNTIPIKAIDRANRSVTLTTDASFEIRPGDRYYLRNSLGALDSPGEWYLNANTGTLYFWPPASMDGATTYASTLDTLVRITRANQLFIQGLTFDCCDGTAIEMQESVGCELTANTISNVGGRCLDAISAIDVTGGSNNGVLGNDISETGSHAISITGGDLKTLKAAGNYADNNYIHHVGIFNKQGVAIRLGGVGNRASHNLIHDCPRMGISFTGNDAIIEFNHIKRVGLETSDLGAIYGRGADWVSCRGTIIRFNWIHDVIGYGRQDAKWVSPFNSTGIYLDDGASDVTVAGNVVARAADSIIHFHIAANNLVQNNIFVNGGVTQLRFTGDKLGGLLPAMTGAFAEYHSQPAWNKYQGAKTSPEGTPVMAGNRILGNIFSYQGSSDTFVKQYNLPYASFQSDYNVIDHPGHSVLLDLPKVPEARQWFEWQKLGFDRHSKLSAALFVNAATDDYRLRPDCPALPLGFKAIPVGQIGLHGDSKRASWPVVEVGSDKGF